MNIVDRYPYTRDKLDDWQIRNITFVIKSQKAVQSLSKALNQAVQPIVFAMNNIKADPAFVELLKKMK